MKKTVLITGCTGFVGKKLVSYLEKENCDVVLLSSRLLQGNKCILHNNYTFTKNDFFEAGVNRVDIIIHMGASVPINRVQMNDINSGVDNIKNTLHLINEIPNIPERFIFASSKNVYGINVKRDIMINESTNVFPDTLYSLSKIYCEMMLSNWAKSNNIGLVLARFDSVYGPGENTLKDYAIPSFIKKAIKGEKIQIYVNKNNKKSYIYLDDICKYLCHLSLHSDYSGILNLVGSESVSIEDIITAIKGVSDKKINVLYQGDHEDVVNEEFDTTELKKVCNIETTPLITGIGKVYEYLKYEME